MSTDSSIPADCRHIRHAGRIRRWVAASLSIWIVTLAIGCSDEPDDHTIGDRSAAPPDATSQAGPAVSPAPVTNPPAARPETHKPNERRYGGRTLEEWQSRIKSLDPQNPDSADAVAGLIAVMQDGSVPSFTRRQAALTLGRIGEPALVAVPALEKLIAAESSDETTTVWAIKALALFGPVANSAAPTVIAALQDPHRQLVVRQACLEALGRIGTAHPDVVGALIGALQLTNPDGSTERKAAIVREGAADAVALIGPPAAPSIPALIRASQDSSEAVRRKVFMALATMGGNAEIAVPAMVEALVFDESPAVRDTAEEALANVGPTAIATLSRLLGADDPELRLRAVRTLRRMRTSARPAVSALQTALQDSDGQIRIEAAEALLQLNVDPNEVLPVLFDGLSSRQRTVRMRASRLLIELGDPTQSTIEQIEKLLEHERPNVRRLAAKTLEQLRAATPSDE